MENFPTLETERLRLREIGPADAAAVLEIRGDPEVMRWFGNDPMETIEQAHAMIKRLAEARAQPNPGWRWGIERKADGKLVGSVGLGNWNRDWGCAMTGYELLTQAQGGGLMREALTAVLAWGFANMGLNRVEAGAHPDNLASHKTLLRQGFVQEGRARGLGFWGGQHHDLLSFGLLRGDWHAAMGQPYPAPGLRVRQVVALEPAMVPQLAALLADAVEGGASVGFVSPLVPSAAKAYWMKVVKDLGPGLALWVAELDGKVVGTVQLAPCPKENGRHRADLQKMLVLSAHRGQGIARKLMEAVESFALGVGRTLLVLDTHAGSPAEEVYRKLGWQRAGEIPDYAANPDGSMGGTAYYFRRLGV